MQNNTLSVSALTKQFGNKTAVSELSFNLHSGEVYCLLGSNGAGKTTTFNMLLGNTHPDAGEVLLNGDSIFASNFKLDQHIFYLPENVSLYPEFSAVENLAYLASLASLDVDDRTLRDALIQCGLNQEALDRPTRFYSKGMRQKAAIALALLKNANLMLLDEPTSGLDPVATREFVALIKQLGEKGVMTVMITHDLSCAHLLADRISILHQGKQVAELPQSESFESLESIYLSLV